MESFIKAIQADNEILADRAAFLYLPLAVAMARGQPPWACLAGTAEPTEGAHGQAQPPSRSSGWGDFQWRAYLKGKAFPSTIALNL